MKRSSHGCALEHLESSSTKIMIDNLLCASYAWEGIKRNKLINEFHGGLTPFCQVFV